MALRRNTSNDEDGYYTDDKQQSSTSKSKKQRTTYLQKFTLLLLEPGEIFFSDHSVIYKPPSKEIAEKEGWEKFYVYSEIKGRLKICSKSLIFDSAIKEIPLIKFPLKNCTSIKEGNSSKNLDPSICYNEKESSIEVESEVTVELLEKNVIKPYNFRRKKLLHCFDLNFKKASDVLPQILQLHRASSLPPNDQNVMIEAIVRSLQKRKRFDYSSIKDSREACLLELEASKITPLVTNPGRILVTNYALYYQPFNSLDTENSFLRIPLENVKRVINRRYILRHVGIELAYEENGFSKFLYLIFKLTEDREKFYQCFMKQEKLHLQNCSQENLVYKWQAGVISNYEYLLQLNSLADRSVNDLTQYPVFPWVIADYSSELLDLKNPKTFRDLSKPVGALNEDRLHRLKERSKEMPEPKFLYGSHYSTPGFVLFYLVRQFPLYMLCLQNGKFDHPDRMFNSLADTWQNVNTNHSDFKELIPEFYDPSTQGDFLQNRKAIYFGTRQNGEPVWDVALPPWAKSYSDLVVKFREALESSYVSDNLHHWIDLIFGYKQKGVEAIKADNVFYPLCYEGSVDLAAITDLNEKLSLENQIMEFGQIPKQIFRGSHPKRSRSLCHYYNYRAACGITETGEELDQGDRCFSPPKLLWLFQRFGSIVKKKETRLHRNAVTHISFIPSGKMVVSLSKDGSLKAYTFPSLERAGCLDSGSLTLSSCAHIPNTTEIIIGSWNNHLYRFNYKLCQKKDGLQAHSDAISCLDINEDVLITGSWDCLVRVWDLTKMNLSVGDSGWSGWKLHMDDLICQMDHDSPVNCVALSPKEKLLASATTDGFVNVWLLQKDCNVLNIKCHDGVVNGLIWSPDGDRILSYGDDGKINLVDSQSGVPISVFNLNHQGVKSALWDGRMLLMGTRNGNIIWCDVAKSEILKTWEAHAGTVTALCPSPDFCYFVSGGEDKKVTLWGPETSLKE